MGEWLSIGQCWAPIQLFALGQVIISPYLQSSDILMSNHYYSWGTEGYYYFTDGVWRLAEL